MSRFFYCLLRLPEITHFKNDTFGLVSSFFLHISNLLCYSVYLIEKYSIWISFAFSDKNTLTELTNCKETTRHHGHLSLCSKSRKTNLRKWPKTSSWAILRSNISKLLVFLKNRFHSNWRSYLVLTSGEKTK